jgi:hypothetical protein
MNMRARAPDLEDRPYILCDLVRELSHRINRSSEPLSLGECARWLSRARTLPEEEQEGMAIEVVALALRSQRDRGLPNVRVVDQLLDLADRLIGAIDAPDPIDVNEHDTLKLTPDAKAAVRINSRARRGEASARAAPEASKPPTSAPHEAGSRRRSW